MIRIERMNLDKAAGNRFGSGFVTVQGVTHRIDFFEDLVDLAQLFELIVLRHSGKVLKKRPEFQDGDRERFRIGTAFCLPRDQYTEDWPLEEDGFYLELGIGQSLYRNWFVSAEDVVRLMWSLVKEERGAECLTTATTN